MLQVSLFYLEVNMVRPKVKQNQLANYLRSFERWNVRKHTLRVSVASVLVLFGGAKWMG